MTIASGWGEEILKTLGADDTSKAEFNALEQREHDTLREIRASGLEDVLTEQLSERYKNLSKRYGSGVIIDMIRRTIPGMIANEIVGIQPMTGPTGTIFSMGAKYRPKATTP